MNSGYNKGKLATCEKAIKTEAYKPDYIECTL